MYLNIALTVTVTLFVLVNAETCPPETLTRPCECHPEYGLTLECRNLKDASIFDGITRRTGVTTFKKLRIFNSTIDSIPPDTLMKKQFNSVEIYDSKLYSLFDGIEESNNIVSLELLNVQFGHPFPWSQLKPLKNLRVFVAKRGFIPELAEDFKNNVNKNLAIFILSDTFTRYISDGIFSDFKKLRQIEINNCGLRNVKRNFFPDSAEKLSDLRLDGNDIRVLPDDIFKNMPELQWVSLQRNQLSTLPATILTAMDHPLGSLNIEKNPLKCDCDLKWIALSNKPIHDIVGKCHSGPEGLKGRELQALTSQDFVSCH